MTLQEFSHSHLEEWPLSASYNRTHNDLKSHYEQQIQSREHILQSDHTMIIIHPLLKHSTLQERTQS